MNLLWRRSLLAFLAGLTILNAEPAAPEAAVENLQEKLVLLSPNTVVLQVGEFKATRRDLTPLLRRLARDKSGKRRQGELSPQQIKQANKQIREHLQRLAQRGLFLLEARAQKLAVTAEERARYEAELEASLQNHPQRLTKEQFLKSLARDRSTLERLTFEDALLLQKLGEVRQAKLTVSAAEMQQMTAYLQAVNKTMQRHNEGKRLSLEGALKEDKIRTDAGFAEIAKELSEGTEARHGGELDYNFLRSELAEVNEIKEFPYQVGDTTPVLETASCYRIMRVLREVPPAKGEKEPRYRCAQILMGKVPVRDLKDTEAIKNEILVKKKQHDLLVYAIELSQKFPVQSVLFPNGVLPRLETTPAPTSK